MHAFARSTASTVASSAAEGCAYRFPNPGVYYVRVSEKTVAQTGPYTVMVANMSPWLTLDVDGSAPRTQYDMLTDGLLILRHMQNPANTNITVGTVGAGATRTPQEISDYLDLLTTALDIDGDGVVDPGTDGVLILRYMAGIRGFRLLENAVAPGASRNGNGEIQFYLDHLMR